MMSELLSKIQTIAKAKWGDITSTIKLLSVLARSLKKKADKGILGQTRKKIEPEVDNQDEANDPIGLNQIKGISSRRIVALICMLFLVLGITSSMVWHKLNTLSDNYSSAVVSSTDKAEIKRNPESKVETKQEVPEMLPSPTEQSDASFLPALKIKSKNDDVKSTQKKVVQNSIKNMPVKSVCGQPYVQMTNTITDTINPQFLLENPVTADQRVSIIVSGLGINLEASDEIIDALPENVTIAVSPYTSDIQGYVDILRVQGFDVLVSLFLEDDKAKIDLGRLALRIGTSKNVKEKILNEYVELAKGSLGFYAEGGRKFLKSSSDTLECLQYIAAHKDFIIAPPDVLMNQFHIAAAQTQTNYMGVTLLSPELDQSSDFISFVKRTGYGILAFEVTTKDMIEEIIQWIKILTQNNIKVVPISNLLQSNINDRNPRK